MTQPPSHLGGPSLPRWSPYLWWESRRPVRNSAAGASFAVKPGVTAPAAVPETFGSPRC